MYNLPYFKAGNPAAVMAFMHTNPFITLSGVDAECRPVATHIPVLLEEKDGALILKGHMMRQTDHHKAFTQNANALAIFTAPHTYVSASWYVDQKQGSTWNYQTVHAHGTLRFLGEEDLLNILTRTTAHFEQDEHSPSLVEKLSPAYIERMIKAIVGFEMVVTELNHVFKLSQNRDKESYENIVYQLKQGDAGAQYIAKAMESSNQHL